MGDRKVHRTGRGAHCSGDRGADRVSPGGGSFQTAERWRRIALQAAEQSRRNFPPEISPPLKLKDAVALPGTIRILLSETEPEAMLKDLVPSNRGDGDIVLALGPEGGWTDEELKLFQAAGWISASLGSTILRAETAAIAALAVVMSEF